MKNKILIATLASILFLQGCVAAAGVAVVGGASMATDKRSIGKQVDDQGIEFAIYKAISKDEALSEQTNISIVSMNASVLVIGQAPTSHLRDRVLKVINETKGKEIVRIHDHIRIGNTISITTQTNDTWLTTKIKSKLFGSDKFDATNVKVVTENAEVFLLGLISAKDADEVAEITRNVSGVSRVYKIFEYQ